MPKLPKIFNLGSLFQDNDLKNIIGRVDTVTNDLITKRKTDQDVDISDDALREVLKAVEDTPEDENGDDDTNVQKLLEKLSIQGNRLARYKIYDEIYSSVQLIKRIVSVYINNCLQQDVLTGKCISVKEHDSVKGSDINVQYYKDFVNCCLTHYKLESNLKDNILHSVIRHGDHFVEIIDLNEDISNLPSPVKTDKMITESSISPLEKYLSVGKPSDVQIRNFETSMSSAFVENYCDIETKVNTDIDLEGYEYLNEVKRDNLETPEDSKSGNGFDKKLLNRVILRYHKPHNITVLTTDYNTIIGYVEIRERDTSDVTSGIGMRFANVIGQLSSKPGNKGTNNAKIIQKIVNKIISDMIQKVNIAKDGDSKRSEAEINKEYEALLHKKLGDDLFYMIKKLYIETNPDHKASDRRKKVLVRFISKDRIVRIPYNAIEYYPYGTSVIDPLVYPGKLYLLTQLTNVVSKLSRAALIRKWTIETGPREHHSGLIQKLKRELRNQSVTVDDLVSFKSVPRVLSDFKDIILLSKKGQRYVDVELQPMQDANIKIADLEDLRREIISLSGVPAPYLGYNDVIELR